MKSPRKLKVLPLAALIFLTVSGGPYGLEPLLTYAGRDWAILLLLITPVLWDVPAILTVLELNGIMPVTGGYYEWVKRALGLRFGFYEGWWTWLYTFVDLAVYPVLFVTYAAYFWPEIIQYKIPVCLIIIWCGAALNILGISPVGKLSLLLGAAVMLPFIIMGITAISNPEYHFSPASTHLERLALPSLGMSLYTIMWNFFGWDNATTYAGEVENASRNYIKAIVVAFISVVLLYLLTVDIMQVSGISASELLDGGFPVLGEWIGGKWLGALIAAGGLASALGLYNAVLLSVSRVPEVMAKDRLLPKQLNYLHPRYKSPYVSIIVCALVVSMMILWSFTELIIIDVTLYGAGLFLEFVTLVVFRFQLPNAVRPFRIKLPVYGLILMFMLPVAVYSLAVYGALQSEGSNVKPALFALMAVCSAELGWQVVRFYKETRWSAGW